jgi:hypothetical protein
MDGLSKRGLNTWPGLSARFPALMASSGRAFTARAEKKLTVSLPGGGPVLILLLPPVWGGVM